MGFVSQTVYKQTFKLHNGRLWIHGFGLVRILWGAISGRAWWYCRGRYRFLVWRLCDALASGRVDGPDDACVPPLRLAPGCIEDCAGASRGQRTHDEIAGAPVVPAHYLGRGALSQPHSLVLAWNCLCKMPARPH